MMAKVTPLRVPTPGANLGEFRIKRFDISRTTDRTEYEKIRTLGNKPGSGISIENIRDQLETTEVTEEEGNRIRQDSFYIVVSWWQRKDIAEKPENPPDVEQGFYAEKRIGGQNEQA